MLKIKKIVEINNENIIPVLFGKLDENINLIENEFDVDIKLNSDNNLRIKGEEKDVEIVSKLLNELFKVLEEKKQFTKGEIEYYISLAKNEKTSKIRGIVNEVITTTSYGKPIRTKTLGQREYVQSIKENPIVFGIGPAGTGKTYLAMAMAVKALREKQVNRLVLTRPAVEAGENLGFLPGDLQEKIDPYLRPLYDALFEILGYEQYVKQMENGIIEVAPLAYMRGRTLDNAFVVLDEAQNTTNEQMKMFLTRLGYGSRAVITGDITQIDLPKGRQSGLKSVRHILDGIEGIGFTEFKKTDVVRHPLVQKIIQAYEEYENINKKE